MTRPPRSAANWLKPSHLICTFAFFFSLLYTGGCGTPAAPLAPTLKLPQLVKDLSGSRSDNTVRLKWTIPRRSTDNILLGSPVEAYVWRTTGSSKKELVGDLKVEVAAAAEYADQLPSQLQTGAPYLLTYTVELLNHGGHSAGVSNSLYSATGAAPPAIANFSATYERDGVELHWRPLHEDGSSIIRISRTLLDPAPAKSSSLQAAPPEPAVQTMLVTPAGKADGGVALDKTAIAGRHYGYRAERILRLDLDTHTTEIMGVESGEVRIETKDIFAPSIPKELAAVADPEQGSIDLAWSADTEPDIAGYIVYRREGDAKPVRISPPDPPIVAPSFRDKTAQPGHEYSYSVSAIDTSGNESARSSESQESLPK